jgi:tRNA (guanine-N7-)-methyltransferase
MTEAPAPPAERRNFYGRVHGKTLRASQKAYLAEDLGALRLDGVRVAENPGRAPIDLGFAGGRPLWLEIGFGGGEHLVHLAALHPAVQLIGAEPFVNGIAMLLGKLRALAADNVRLHDGDVRDLFDVLPDASLGRVYLNYPDPWPKARHHRRRFVTPGYLRPLARVMAPGAELRIATDIASYAEQARAEVLAAGYAPVSDGPLPWEGWLSTRYEQKALREGRAPGYLVFRRL